jgi:hypothetical protein
MASSTAYSSTPLAKKLGIKEGQVIDIINPPEYYFKLFTDFPGHVKISNDIHEKKNLIHYFVKEQTRLLKDLFVLKNQILQNGMIWISWPKKSSKIETDITEDLIRKLALENGLVDIKVCAIDEIWSGLKLVIPIKLRK